ncbi:non-canonical purine NTP pyrophosphatase, RdgB/HAM1 family [Helicobacter valdiviensis]|uniref:dITP/XTP pyrophosphatase n=1 Tax=Helicobacter valdiviensis TaxID=1458358 RepID=A0A2W6PMG2_9HELI|nr:RdgB/HAM1 family non-canonical purine NTP pyrophosphatase [Helicobacter valdiviensis]PZT47863.1 non-canonical purine NTP pyrophosphatase, RdgB/HAM1 family [Helicobacter valdiviensis]
MRLILASSNSNKLREIKEIYHNFKDTFEILSWDSLITPFEIEENGTSFKENALIKSKAVFSALQEANLLEKNDVVLSDDSGICVDLLGGAPGIYSARYSGGDDKDNLKKLLDEVAKLENQTSLAHYCASIGISSFYGDFNTYGFMYGSVISTPKGTNGFGYDPMFIPKGYTKTLAELSSEEKNRISHRKIALENASYLLRALSQIHINV